MGTIVTGWPETELKRIPLEEDDFKDYFRSDLQLAMLLFFDQVKSHWTIQAGRLCEHRMGICGRAK